MNTQSRAFKWGSVLWAMLIGTALIALTISVLLPSTKRARINLDQLRKMQEAENAATTQSTTGPATTQTAQQGNP